MDPLQSFRQFIKQDASMAAGALGLIAEERYMPNPHSIFHRVEHGGVLEHVLAVSPFAFHPAIRLLARRPEGVTREFAVLVPDPVLAQDRREGGLSELGTLAPGDCTYVQNDTHPCLGERGAELADPPVLVADIEDLERSRRGSCHSASPVRGTPLVKLTPRKDVPNGTYVLHRFVGMNGDSYIAFATRR